MTPRSPRHAGPPAALALTAVLTGALLAGCGPDRPAAGGPALRLVGFSSCDDLLAGLRRAVRPDVGPYGVTVPGGTADVARGAMPEAATGADAGAAAPGAAAPGARAAVPAPDTAGAAAPGAGPAYSATNTRESGVDEPDLVKTDGRRIVTVHAGVLRVVDAASRRFTGSLDLKAAAGVGAPGDLLLAGDHALVIQAGYGWASGGVAVPLPAPGGADIADVPGRPTLPPTPDAIAGPRLLLVDLSGPPRLLGSYEMDGSLLDARQVGSTVRVVTRSAPRLRFPGQAGTGGATGAAPGAVDGGTVAGTVPGGAAAPAGPAADARRTAANRAYLDTTGPDDWLPRYRATGADGRVVAGRVGCDAVSVPASYSALSMITISTFDLGRDALGGGDPVTVVADAGIVYATAASLYLADTSGGVRTASPEGIGPARTAVYRFDTRGERPVYRSAGLVPGTPLNQYALDEWDGTLRVATTTSGVVARDVPLPDGGDSAVYVLRERGTRLVVAGHVGGLGRGERIYAVRFAGDTGYVVTFRQTDPLYTVDLSDPARPRVTGALSLSGYSAYLHPVGDGRIVGIGQEADARGRVTGTQLSLFDVADAGKPRLLDRLRMPSSYSDAEHDPHAFLYWPATRLLVVPVTPGTPGAGGALALRVGSRSLADLGGLDRPAAAGMVTRALVVDRTLWTLSDTGLAGNDLDSLAPVAWLPF